MFPYGCPDVGVVLLPQFNVVVVVVVLVLVLVQYLHYSTIVDFLVPTNFSCDITNKRYGIYKIFYQIFLYYRITSLI